MLLDGKPKDSCDERGPAEHRVDAGVQLQPFTAHGLFEHLRDDLQLLQVLLEGLQKGQIKGWVNAKRCF